MAKDISFSIAEPMSEDLAMRMMNFLITATAKRENVNVSGTIRKIEKAS